MALPKRPTRPMQEQPSRPSRTLPTRRQSPPKPVTSTWDDDEDDDDNFIETPFNATEDPLTVSPVSTEEEDETTPLPTDYSDFNLDQESFGIEAQNEVLETELTGDFDYEFAMDYDDYIEAENMVLSTNNSDPTALIRYALKDFPEDLIPSVEAFFDLVDDDEVSEILMNSYNKIGYKKKGHRLRAQKINFQDTETYHRFINEILLPLTDNPDRIDGSNYFIEGQLTFPSTDPDQPPVLGRTTIITPPVVINAKVTIAKKSRISYTLDDMRDFGTMTDNMMNFLKCLAHGKATVVFAGVSGAGKTTLIEAMSHYFDSNDRIIVVEDTPEIRIPSGDVVNLVAKTSRPGLDEKEEVPMEWLVKATNRMRPDRIIVGECRGGEFAEFLIAANSGADGSMTTIHASTPRQALEKMVSLAVKNASSKSESSVIRDINSTVQIIVQADIVDGRHVISSILEVSSMQNASGKINSHPIFEYDQMTQRFIARNQPSDDLKVFLERHGVELPPQWFR